MRARFPVAAAGVLGVALARTHRSAPVAGFGGPGQAARVSDITAFMTVRGPGQPGQLVEAAATKELFSQPAQQATMDYITGKVG